MDRNKKFIAQPGNREVALLAEGVDRNNALVQKLRDAKESPSSQRAWIEILALVPGFAA